ncbi:hypothetical protein E8A74_12610 [Polyangium fumosum]|uniref:Uncharacterized protein n=1 Tax=Polyangium fumosum TaxID=889272 RepID=A0A4U1JG92_9BACT|nr:hypothetical protein E8A74_12610 [Polyangium fumosum]
MDELFLLVRGDNAAQAFQLGDEGGIVGMEQGGITVAEGGAEGGLPVLAERAEGGAVELMGVEDAGGIRRYERQGCIEAGNAFEGEEVERERGGRGSGSGSGSGGGSGSGDGSGSGSGSGDRTDERRWRDGRGLARRGRLQHRRRQQLRRDEEDALRDRHGRHELRGREKHRGRGVPGFGPGDPREPRRRVGLGFRRVEGRGVGGGGGDEGVGHGAGSGAVRVSARRGLCVQGSRSRVRRGA